MSAWRWSLQSFLLATPVTASQWLWRTGPGPVPMGLDSNPKSPWPGCDLWSVSYPTGFLQWLGWLYITTQQSLVSPETLQIWQNLNHPYLWGDLTSSKKKARLQTLLRGLITYERFPHNDVNTVPLADPFRRACVQHKDRTGDHFSALVPKFKHRMYS